LKWDNPASKTLGNALALFAWQPSKKEKNIKGKKEIFSFLTFPLLKIAAVPDEFLNNRSMQGGASS